MPDYRAPGVFVEEIPATVRRIEGVPTATAALVGETSRGPTAPFLVTSFDAFLRRFGGRFAADRYLPDAARGFFENGGKRLYVCRVVGAGAQTATARFGTLVVAAAGPGSGGNTIFASIGPGATEGHFALRVACWAEPPADLEAFVATGIPAPAVEEAWPDLSADPESPAFCLTRVNAASELVTLSLSDTAIPLPHPGVLLAGGSDTPVTAADHAGEPIGDRAEPQGLAALRDERCREVALVHAPFFAPAQDDVSRAVVEHCESARFRFAVIDTEPDPAGPATPDPRAAVGPVRDAAAYTPWLTIADPGIGDRRDVPPGGFVLGVYARTDSERGVARAPANQAVRGVAGLRTHFAVERQEELADRGVNAIRAFPDRGILVWGARTLSSDPEWRYVPVRRLCIHIEHSISEGLRWAVFEQNDERLWDQVTRVVEAFLHDIWRGGALQGATPREAYFVACGPGTMTRDDIRDGRLVAEVGIAPVRPAEFVILRLSQLVAAPPPPP